MIYGKKPYCAAVIHGGPGAAGGMAPVARELSGFTGVLEPIQTARSIDGQVRELHALLDKLATEPLSLIGWSWGAWLGYLLAAAYPSNIKKLILVGCGPFEEQYAATIMETRLRRLTEEERSEVESIMKKLDDPRLKNGDELLSRFGGLLSRTDSYEPLAFDNESVDVDFEIYQRVWNEAREMRRNGELLRRGRLIRCPVVAIHGDYDPHPHEGVAFPLSSVLADFRCVLLERCGHTPWIEKSAKDRFFEILRDELR